MTTEMGDPAPAGGRRAALDGGADQSGGGDPSGGDDRSGVADPSAMGVADPSAMGVADPSAARVVTVGRVGKAHGIRGDVFVEPWTDAPEQRFAPGVVMLTEPVGHGPLTVESSRDHSGKLVVHFAGVEDRGAAAAIRGAALRMAASERPPIEDPDEFYDTDLIGLAVRTVAGAALGRITDVLHSAAGSLLAIDHGGREVLLPFRKEFVPVVDVAAGFAEVDLPDGLLEL